MRVIEASPIDWSGVRERLGLHVEEVGMPAEVEALYAAPVFQDELSEFLGWDMAVDLPVEKQLESAVVATLIHEHAPFEHVPMGYWRHPLSLPSEVIGKILGSFGIAQPINPGPSTPIGRRITAAAF